MTLRRHGLKGFLLNTQSKREHLPLGPSKVGNLLPFCRMMPFAAIRSYRLMNACIASEFLFDSTHIFFTRHPLLSKGWWDRRRSRYNHIKGYLWPGGKVSHGVCGTRLCDDRLLSVHRHRIRETLITDIQYYLSNRMNGEGEEQLGLHGMSWQEWSNATNPREVVLFGKNCHPGCRRDLFTFNEVRLRSWTASSSIDLWLANCYNASIWTSKLRVRLFIVAILAWLSLWDP